MKSSVCSCVTCILFLLYSNYQPEYNITINPSTMMSFTPAAVLCIKLYSGIHMRGVFNHKL